MKIKIWGARGSIPSPTRPDEIREKIIAALLGISQIEPGEFREELLAAILENPQALHEASGQSVNLAAAKSQVKRRQIVRAYLDKLPPLSIGTASGNTPCIEIQTGEEIFIIDAVSGIRQLGLELMKGACGQGQGVIHLFFSHPHWDHIQGFPFFRPAFVPGNKLHIYSVHDLETALQRQQEAISFPVPLEYMQAELNFIRLKQQDSLDFGDLNIRLMRNHHPGDSFSFRFERGDKIFVYASDASYPAGDDLRPHLNFFADADVLIFDSQFTLQESDEKEDWGHSSALVGLEMAQEAHVKNLVLFHYDPTYSDKDLEKILEDTLKFQLNQYPAETPVNVIVAQEGQTFDLTPPKTTQMQQIPGGRAAIIKPTGIFNERVAAELKKELAGFKSSGWPPQIIIDMAGVEMLQVSGLRALVKLRREHPGTPMVLAGPSLNVQQVIELAGYRDFFASYPSIHTAVSALQTRETLNLPGQTLKERYYIEFKMGDGQLGTIFKATDTQFSRSVAVKILSASFSDEAIERFLQQAREIINLVHSNIVSIYDCDQDRGLSYMAVEFIDGSTLQNMLIEQPGQRLPLDLTLHIGLSIARALDYAHAHGVIHGDLKPQNVLISGAREVKISDFGLGRLETGKSLLTDDLPLALVTAQYLAPEQIMGQPLDPRTDLYALGVILYELVTGQPPFTGNDQEVLEHHRRTLPQPPRQLNPKLSQSLEYLILKLLEKDPDKRYDSARQVERILLGMATTAGRSVSGQNMIRQRWPALAGRSQELQQLLSLWAETQQGRGQLVFIQGEVGTGKTRLVQEFVDRLDQATILLGQCQQSEGSLAYQPFIDALKFYFVATPEVIANKQVGCLLHKAAAFIPELHQLLSNIMPPGSSLDSHNANGASAAASVPQSFSLTQLLQPITAKQPWLLVLDDVDWADYSSLQLLDYLGRHCSGMALMIVATLGQEVSDNKLLTEVFTHLKRHTTYTSIKLHSLALPEVQALLESVWGQPVTEELAAPIYQRTQGNPLFVEELAKTLVDEGSFTRKKGRWNFDQVIESSLPQRTREAISRRVRCLSKETQTLLQQAAVIGVTFNLDDLSKISDLPEADVLKNLDIALERHLIKDLLSEGNYCFNHLRTQQILYANLSLLKQRLIHRRVGERLEQRHHADPDRLAALLAYHYFQARELEKGLPYSIQAAAQAQALYASHQALIWYTQALDALDQLEQNELTRPQQYELLLAREHIYDNLGERPAQAADLAALQSLTQILADPARQAVVHNRQARYDRAVNHLPQAMTEAQAALIAARQAKNPALQGESLLHLAHISASQGQLEMARAHMHDAQEILSQGGNPSAKAKTLNGLGDTYKLLQDFTEAENYYQQSLTLNRSIGNRYGEAVSLNSLGSICLALADYSKALIYCQQSLEINRLIGHRRGAVLCLENLAVAYQALNQPEAARRCAEEAQTIRQSFSDMLSVNPHEEISEQTDD